MRPKIMLLAAMLLFVSANAIAQQTENPCAVAVAAAELQTQTKTVRVEELEKENARLKGLLESAGRVLATAQSHSASLAARNAEKDVSIAEHEKTIWMVTAERDKAQRKIKAANGRWMCEAFHLGCIEDK